METNNEIIDNLKESVIAKLDELDSSKNHDSTLIDYILVMVVNQKSKFEMKHNLALFLGKIVDDFVNWLFDYLSEPKTEDLPNSIDQFAAKDEVLLEIQQVTNGNKTETIKDAPEIYVPEVTNTLKTKKSSKKKLKSAIISNIAEKKTDKQKEFTKSKKRSIVNDEETTLKTKKRRETTLNEDKPLPKPDIPSIDSKKTDNTNLSDDLKNKPIIAESMENEKPDNTKENEIHFLVTLDGVKDMFKDDLILMDEEFDPELMKEDLTTFNPASSTKNESNVQQAHPNKSTERCKYWPSCLNGSCEYFHPVTKCNTFPYCRFGDKCLYIHPTCKYDTVCSRKDCPFVHTSKRIPTRPQVHPAVVVPTCKYYPNCMKPACEFFHPKACHFGPACKSFNCPFIHSANQTNIPHPSRLKWSSTKTSNLPLNNSEEIEIKLI